MKDKRREVRAPSIIQNNEMKTNKSWSIATLLILILSATIGLSSCNKNEDGINDGKSKIVGTWKTTFDTGYELLTLKSDGTGTHVEYDDGKFDDPEDFKWSYDDSTSILTFIWLDDEGQVDEKEEVRLVWISEKSFVFYKENILWEKQ